MDSSYIFFNLKNKYNIDKYQKYFLNYVQLRVLYQSVNTRISMQKSAGLGNRTLVQKYWTSNKRVEAPSSSANPTHDILVIIIRAERQRLF